jgi:hypothetical protein
MATGTGEVGAAVRYSPDRHLLALAVVALLIAVVRFRLLGLPLERDEGEFAYLGTLMLDGVPPYGDAISVKLPGAFAIYALLMSVFGMSIEGIHLGLLVANLATMALLYLAFRRLFNSAIAFFAAAAYGMMSLSPSVLGSAAHATQFVMLFAAGGLLLWTRFRQSGTPTYLFCTGLLFGLAFVIKQHSVFFIILGGLLVLGQLAYGPRRAPGAVAAQLGIYSTAAALPYVLTAVVMYACGVWEQFWFWTFQYFGQYFAGIPVSEGLDSLASWFASFRREFEPVLWLAAAGVPIVLLRPFAFEQKLFTLLFAVCAFLTACPGFYFTPHYFVPFLSGLGLLAAITVNTLAAPFARVLRLKSTLPVSAALFCAVAFTAVTRNSAFYLSADPARLSHAVYGANPFLESLPIASYIQQHSTPADRVAVLGSEPQIFFYCRRRSATRFISTYPLMAGSPLRLQFQEDMISDIEREQPKFVVFFSINSSWLWQPDSPTRLFDWATNYLTDRYQIVGVADILGRQETHYIWGDAAAAYQPRSTSSAQVLIRRDS